MCTGCTCLRPGSAITSIGETWRSVGLSSSSPLLSTLPSLWLRLERVNRVLVGTRQRVCSWLRLHFLNAFDAAGYRTLHITRSVLFFFAYDGVLFVQSYRRLLGQEAVVAQPCGASAVRLFSPTAKVFLSPSETFPHFSFAWLLLLLLTMMITMLLAMPSAAILPFSQAGGPWGCLAVHLRPPSRPLSRDILLPPSLRYGRHVHRWLLSRCSLLFSSRLLPRLCSLSFS